MSPYKAGSYCSRCGAVTIGTCPSCGADIPGDLRGSGPAHRGEDNPPSFCYSCGAPYPWTEKKLEAMRQMVAEAEGLDEHEREALQESMTEITRDTPAAAAAAERAKKLIGKVAPKVGALLWEWSVEVASTTAAKVLKP